MGSWTTVVIDFGMPRYDTVTVSCWGPGWVVLYPVGHPVLAGAASELKV